MTVRIICILNLMKISQTGWLEIHSNYRRFLINLIGNSVKFTQNGDVIVRVKKLEDTNSKVSLHFEIEDNGVGISKKKQKSIFETFSQASLQINRKFGGTGTRSINCKEPSRING